jgi:predicted phosphoribosyltransferase
VAFDGTIKLNESMLAMLGLSEVEKWVQIEMTREKVAGRVKEFSPGGTEPELSAKDVLLVDDGIASGFTMLTAVEAIANQGAG